MPPGVLGYGTACAAIEAMTQRLAVELGPSGVRAVCLRPHAISDAPPNGSYTGELFGPAAAQAGVSVEQMLVQWGEDFTLLGRLPTLAQVADRRSSWRRTARSDHRQGGRPDRRRRGTQQSMGTCWCARLGSARCRGLAAMDEVFKALADPSRRQLLDSLNERSGQNLRELCAGLDMARQSVTKHLAILEAANLVVIVRRGRERLHYLNAAPINDIADRWINHYHQERAKALSDLKNALEGRRMSAPTFVYKTYIKTSPPQLWQALTDPAFTERYWGSSSNPTGSRVRPLHRTNAA